MRDLISIVVPVLEEEREIVAVLDHLAALAGDWEVIVVDGGSRDATAERARAHSAGARVLTVSGGRAAQQNAGAAVATGFAIAFLHADSRLPPGAHASLWCAARDGATVGGNFALRFDGGDLFSLVVGAIYTVNRRLGFYYGDSTMWATADAFARLGGFRLLPIMDDYDFCRRLGRHGRTARLPGPATTSARRWRGQGISRTVLSWIVIKWLYLAGFPPDRLAALYRRVR